LPALFEDAVARRQHAPMLDFQGRPYSYVEMEGLVRRVATGLVAAGIRPGDRIGLLMPNVPHHLCVYYGALRMGAIVVSYPSLQSAESLLRAIEDSGTRLLFVMDGWTLLPRATELLDGSLLERIVVGTLPEALPFGKALVHRLMRRGKASGLFGDSRVSGFQALLDNDGTAPAAAIDAERDVALIHYADSGAARPKAAMFTHQALTANARQINAIDPRNAIDHPGEVHRAIAAMPLSTLFGHACIVTRAVFDGGEIVLTPRLEAGDVIAAIGRTRPSCMVGTPALYAAMLDHPQIAGTDFSTLRVVVTGGAPLQPEFRDRFQERTGVVLSEGYGVAEAGIVACNPIEGTSKPGSVGQPLPETRVALLSCGDVTRAPLPGQPGEIIVRGPQIMSRYWGDGAGGPFVERGGRNWLRTGDVGTIDDEGYIRIVDRLADLFQVGGALVFPGQIEAILDRHALVAEALVAGLPDASGRQAPIAFVTLRAGGGAIDGEVLLNWLNPQLGRHEQVGRIIVRDSLPRTPAGALDRSALMAQGCDGLTSGPAAA
jgi:long-chain acyl-CoA synthetase